MRYKFFAILAPIMFVFLSSFGQKVGIGLAGASSGSMNMELLYMDKTKNIFKLGMTYQFADTRGKLVPEQLSNYGKTQDGNGEYFLTIDFGYGKIFKEKFLLDIELSAGSENSFQNYIDNRFNGGGYHLITSKNTVLGAGLDAGYLFKENFTAFAGFNTIRKAQVGIRFFLF
ncbi:hypothetical protein SAMN04489724_0070 [Algoriphagus locisalis]|uniref:Outer membrane protein beta-barrel domain-containing protein n=1 Tax=Algoriphagus locisalis TaxID=305507 RepID=A0A1I7E4X6_9BACT|nr:hypothetical protein [Algoriphagus locisalis]SFU18965.1 hypothetical protein SAMN04489724_0070 [Algoriphagus locisalis]